MEPPIKDWFEMNLESHFDVRELDQYFKNSWDRADSSQNRSQADL